MDIISHDIDNYNIKEYVGKKIYIIENLFTKEDCNEFINLINQLPKCNEYIKPGSNVQGHKNILREMLLIDDSNYYKFDISLKNVKITNKLNGLSQYDIRKYIQKLNKKFENVYGIFKKINGRISVKYNSDYIMRIITGATLLHADNLVKDKSFILNQLLREHESDSLNMNMNVDRALTTIIALNSDYDGGELVFPDQDVTIKLKEGNIVCFPPYWTHPHRSNELLNDTNRYTITCWHGDIQK